MLKLPTKRTPLPFCRIVCESGDLAIYQTFVAWTDVVKLQRQRQSFILWLSTRISIIKRWHILDEYSRIICMVPIILEMIKRTRIQTHECWILSVCNVSKLNSDASGVVTWPTFVFSSNSSSSNRIEILEIGILKIGILEIGITNLSEGHGKDLF